ncbi:FkbM family methyltransferase [Glycocaulis sp.]
MARKSSKPASARPERKPARPAVASSGAGPAAAKLLEAARLHWRIGDWGALYKLTQAIEAPEGDASSEQVELCHFAVQAAFMSGDVERGRDLARGLSRLPDERDRTVLTLAAGAFASLSRARLLTGHSTRTIDATRNALDLIDDLEDTETLARLRIDADRRMLTEKMGLRVRDPFAARKLFIDCGGHDGCSALMFLLNNPDYDCVSFEPNPAFWEHYDGLPTKLVKAAVYTHDGEVEFIIDPVDGDGSTLIEGKPVEFHGTLTNDECPRISVPCVDLSRFVAENAEHYDSIALKLDVEGAEYDILEKMLSEGTLEQIDTLYCEFHGHKMGLPLERHNRIHTAVTKIVDVMPWDAIALSFSSEMKTSRRQRLRRFLIDNIAQNRGY